MSIVKKWSGGKVARRFPPRSSSASDTRLSKAPSSMTLMALFVSFSFSRNPWHGNDPLWILCKKLFVISKELVWQGIMPGIIVCSTPEQSTFTRTDPRHWQPVGHVDIASICTTTYQKSRRNLILTPKVPPHCGKLFIFLLSGGDSIVSKNRTSSNELFQNGVQTGTKEKLTFIAMRKKNVSSLFPSNWNMH